MEGFNSTDARGKVSMKKLFGRKNITKDGKEGKVHFLSLCACNPMVSRQTQHVQGTFSRLLTQGYES